MQIIKAPIQSLLANLQSFLIGLLFQFYYASHNFDNDVYSRKVIHQNCQKFFTSCGNKIPMFRKKFYFVTRENFVLKILLLLELFTANQS